MPWKPTDVPQLWFISHAYRNRGSFLRSVVQTSESAIVWRRDILTTHSNDKPLKFGNIWEFIPLSVAEEIRNIYKTSEVWNFICIKIRVYTWRKEHIHKITNGRTIPCWIFLCLMFYSMILLFFFRIDIHLFRLSSLGTLMMFPNKRRNESASICLFISSYLFLIFNGFQLLHDMLELFEFKMEFRRIIILNPISVN